MLGSGRDAPDQIVHMDASIISALAALTGAAVGGFTNVFANWLSHRVQARAQSLQHETNRRQLLYRDFIDEASKCYIDALQHGEADISGLVGLYAKLSRMRIQSSERVVRSADKLGNFEIRSHRYGASIVVARLQSRSAFSGSRA